MVEPLPPVLPDVGLWLVELDVERDVAADLSANRALLSPDEIARADRFVFERHRRRYIVGRAALRRLLAGETGIDPRRVAFEYGPSGKPALADTGTTSLWFNVSHSDRLGLVALTRRGPVGVDIEQKRGIDDVLRLAQTAFSENELRSLREMEPTRRHDAFFAGWTRKEAYIKARGDGLGSLGAFDVSLEPRDARLLRAIGGPRELARWTMAAFVPAAGFTAALCVGNEARPTKGP
jgi:4'-phosphopantetheinyl transferase